MTNDTPCVGCGGRNPPEVAECLWCGRPRHAVVQAPGGPRWIGLAAVLVAMLGAGLVVAWGVLASQLLTAGATPATRLPTPAPTSAPPSPSPPATELPAAEAAPPPPPVEFVRVANTGGLGISLRREPRADAPRVTARPENTVLQVVGPETVSEGRVWREVQDAQGNRGWAPADFLVPVPPPS
ncbi:MAG TPA: SH3 domain-containing protein [Chloroflexota bacterium]|nr:SH3 domain-containing protein [Chloroflexota bacterium]